MDRKKIYIGIIIVCFGGTIGVLYYSFKGTSTKPSPAVELNTSKVTNTTNPVETNVISKNGDIVYTAPAVFPTDTKFDWTLLESGKYKQLISNPGITLDPSEVGREDPLKPY